MRRYSVAKTAYKTIEPPAAIFAVAILAATIFDIEKETALAGAVAVYGVYSGVVNWLKNRKKGNADN